MEIISTVDGVRRKMEALRCAGKRIAFVPTMGALHDGHLSLCRRARKEADIVIMSIYVNPTQFGPNEDLDRYPRDREGDERKAGSAGVDILFYPDAALMYEADHRSWVSVDELGSILCGQSRPGHFRGVTTIVAKLLNIVRPHDLIMGQKDAQQAAIIQRMIRDLNFDTRLVLAPIIRETDGLAMSSRNVYLRGEDRHRALILHQSLTLAERLIERGETDPNTILDQARSLIQNQEGVTLDYLEIRSYPGLQPVTNTEGRVLIAGAILLADVRLIDNIIIEQGSKQ